jgi:adenylosuccinate lyase
VLLALIESGLSREAAYKIVQRHSMAAWELQTPFRGLLETDSEVTDRLDKSKLDEVFDYQPYLKHIDSSFKRIGLL